MTNNDKARVLKLLSDEAREYDADADWYDSQHAQGLSELCRYAQKTIYDFIEVAREECKDADAIDELLDQVRYDYFNRYKYLHGEHFDHLAELAMSGYMALGDIAMIIELNK